MKRLFRLPRGRAGVARDVEREIELHIDLRTREFEESGMSHDDARRAAIAAFGDRAEIESEVKHIRASTVGERARRDWLGDLAQDVTVALRMLHRAPGFALVAILTLAIGIGANTAVFSVLRSVLLRPLPYPHAEQLVQLWTDHRALGRQDPEWLDPPEFVDWREGNRTFSSMSAYLGWGPDLSGLGDPESLSGLMVSGNFFETLQVRPQLGRLFTMRDDDASTERVVVLSDGFWQRRFGGDRSVLGRRLILNGEDWTVVGVLPASFSAPLANARPDVIRPIRRPADSRCGRGCITVRAIGRMKSGVTLEQAQADVAGIVARLAREYPQTYEKVGAWLIPLHEQITGDTKTPLLVLSAAVGFVLLIGCVNLANLLLVRGAARGREIAVRAALGAGRGRVVRQLLTENLLLAAIGGAAGLGLGVAGSRVLAVLVPESVREVQAIRADAGVLAFAAALSVLAGLLFGLLPALQAVRAGLMTPLRSGRGETGRHGNALRGTLVVTQLSLAVVLLVSAGLLLRSFLAMQRVDLGYRSSGVYLTGVTFPAARYRDPARGTAAIQELLTKLRANRAIATAEATDLPPLSRGDQDVSVVPVGEPRNPDRPPSIWYRAVTPGYFQAIGMHIVAGRGISTTDGRGAPLVGVVNEEAARRYWPGKNPVGRSLSLGDSPGSPQLTVVGVVASARQDGPNQPYKAELFVPIERFPSRGATIVVAPARDLESMTTAFRQALREVDPLVPLARFDPIDALVGETVALPRLYATLVTIFAAAALFLAALGVYGTMAYSVTQRQREIGVRLALGAAPADVGRLILSNGGWLALAGLVIGLAASMLSGQVMAKLLFGVGRYDPQTFLTVPIVLGVITLLACWLPARRAMRLDPLEAIREE
jgi:putative ABC transport system permease protein